MLCFKALADAAGVAVTCPSQTLHSITIPYAKNLSYPLISTYSILMPTVHARLQTNPPERNRREKVMGLLQSQPNLTPCLTSSYFTLHLSPPPPPPPSLSLSI
ncbi:hypothetical protein VNO80_14842 [Phaseolus coccineus]|uniref:Uncharacterized protein n=1 Tax=Phaseolus coccineus TaxID=3886 RepID=A0AAN9MP52_PHACN